MKKRFMKGLAFVLAIVFVLSSAMPTLGHADSGYTDGGDSGFLLITYNLSISTTDAYATTSAGSYSPNPNLSTYVEARYYHPDSQTIRTESATGAGSARAVPPYNVIEAKSVSTASSPAWGYFRGTIIKP